MYRRVSGKDAAQYSALQAIINDTLYLKLQHLIAPSDFPFIPHHCQCNTTEPCTAKRLTSHNETKTTNKWGTYFICL